MNTGQADIHMMATAEAIYDAMEESTPKELKEGQWHCPFEDKIGTLLLNDFTDKYMNNYYRSPINWKVPISTAMSARTSYTIIGNEKEFIYEDQIKLHDRMTNQVPFHASPFEHCARAMSNEEYLTYFRGKADGYDSGVTEETLIINPETSVDNYGWCRNFRGFIQYRELIN